ncbi:MAG TPA: caspase family protein [Polyangiaceae bacterium]|nr:caspase family protein [Polyangiaceae bacterium]
MTRSRSKRSLLVCAALVVISAGACTPEPKVPPSQARSVRVFVVESPSLTTTDPDCELHYSVLRQSLPYAVRQSLRESGFTVVRQESDLHDADARIEGTLSYCKRAGTCVNGSFTMNLLVSGAVVERHIYTTGDTTCASSPTIDDLPAAFTTDMGQKLLGSERVAQLSRGTSLAKAQYDAQHPTAATPVAVVPGPAAAAATPTTPIGEYTLGAPQPNAYALVVGIEKYRDLPPPVGARADAEQFARLAVRTLGIPEDHVRLLLDAHATRGDIDKALAWLELNVPIGGRVYFFYSGHGAPDAVSGSAYVLPYDGDPAALDQTAVPMSKLTERLSKTKASESVAFVDACFSGAGGRSVLPKGARPLVRVQAPSVARGVALLSSAGASEISGATPDGSNGLFSEYLLEALGRAGGDVDGDYQISLEELRSFVEPRVAREARLQNRVQTPTLSLPAGTDGRSLIIAFGVKR